MQLSSFRRVIAVFGISLLLILATRLPIMPAHLFSFDSVNLALALEEFDPTRNQPQPPGYPLFVGEAKLVYWLLGTPERTFALLKILISGLALGMLYLLGRRMFSSGVGLVAAALLLVNPAFWFAGLTSPLRPHLSLFSILVAYGCWRAMTADPRYFYLASLLLGLSGGFRAGLPVVLFPLWLWVGWRSGRGRLLGRGALLLVAGTLAWVSILVVESGGPARLLSTFGEYLGAQTHQTSPVMGASLAGWRHMAGRAILWTGLGALPWLWTLPFAWRSRHGWPDWSRRLQFIGFWMIPAFLFNLLIHTGDPGHTLATIPAVCLIGGISLLAAEQRFPFRWISFARERGIAIWATFLLSYLLLYLAQEPKPRSLVLWVAVVLSLLWLFPHSESLRLGGQGPDQRGPIVSFVLLANIFLFFAEITIPQRTPAQQFRGWASVQDAFRFATFESSYEGVYWVEQMTALAMSDIAVLQTTNGRPLVAVWWRDGVPVWRKVCFYQPSLSVYVLDEKGDPAAPATRAQLWVGKDMRSQYSGDGPIRLPLPKNARILWLVGGGWLKELARVVPLQKAQVLYYTDLPSDSGSFRWGSFQFVPDGSGNPGLDGDRP